MVMHYVTADAPTIEELLAREDTSETYSPCFGFVQREDDRYRWTMAYPPEVFKPHEQLGIGIGEYFYAMMRSTDFSDYPFDDGIVGWMWISQGWMTAHKTEEELARARPSKSRSRRHIEISVYLDQETGTLHHRYAPEGEEPVVQVLPCPAEGWGSSRGAVLAAMDHLRQEIRRHA